MKRTPWPAGVALLGCALLFSAPLRAQNQAAVAIRATSSADYAQRRLEKGNPAAESYVFYQGQFFPGLVHDPHLQGTSFTDIVNVLARSLVKQDYYPVKNQKDAALLLVVHWGSTLVEDNPIREFQQDDFNSAQSTYNQQVQTLGAANADPSTLNFNLMIHQNEDMATQSSVLYNAHLLGFDESLAKELKSPGAAFNGTTDKEQALRAELNDPRYFIIVMAYDNQALQKDHQHKLLWTTRISMRAAGNSFTQALPALCRAGSKYFGRQLPELVTETTELGFNGNVEIGGTRAMGEVK